MLLVVSQDASGKRNGKKRGREIKKMNQDLAGKKAVVIVRGNPDDHNPDPIQDFINQHQIEVRAEWFYDWRSGDTDWAFRRYEDRLGFSKGVERGS